MKRSLSGCGIWVMLSAALLGGSKQSVAGGQDFKVKMLPYGGFVATIKAVK